MSSRRRPLRRPATAIGACLLAFTAAACGSADTDDTGGSAGGGSGASVSAATDAVEQAREATDDFTAPAPAIDDVASLSGRTVMYVPIVAAVPYFGTFETAFGDALSQAGLEIQTCDAQANPSNAASCLDQAVQQDVAAVVLDQVPPALAPQAIAGLADAGIPLVLLGEPLPADSGPLVHSITADQAATLSLAANAIIDDSDGAAHALLIRVIDSDVSADQMDGATEAFEENCPDCVVTEIQTKTADLQNLPTAVSAALLRDPQISYLLPQFDIDVEAAIQGAKQANRTVRVASTVAELGGLQRIDAGQEQFADVGWDLVRESWLTTDMVLRLATGAEVDDAAYTVPLRLFDETNLDDLTLTQDAWENGSWYGSDDYQDTLLDLWGRS